MAGHLLYILILGAIALLVAYLFGILLAAPIALLNKLRGGSFSVSKKTRYTLQGITGISVIFLLVFVSTRPADYTDRAQASEGMALTSALKTPLAEYYEKNGTFTGVTIDELTDVKQGRFVKNLRLAHVSGDTVVVIATYGLSHVNKSIKGLEFRNVTVDGGKTWTCGAAIKNPLLRGKNQVPVKIMPGACK